LTTPRLKTRAPEGRLPKKRSNWALCSAIAGLAAGLLAPVAASAQISLSTTVFLAQRHSTAVRIAEADLMKSEAALA